MPFPGKAKQPIAGNLFTMVVDERLKRAKRSLEGLSVGDAFGQTFFGDSGVVWSRVVGRVEPPSPWEWTDDTAMARAIVRVLESHRQLSPNHLADAFAREYRREPFRGYGAGAAEVLNQIADGTPWQTASSLLFAGSGSYGNGAAMRAAPIGAYFADDVEAVVEQATIASQITHFHPDGVAGGVAVALAAAWWAQPREVSMFEFVLQHMPPGAVRRAVLKASEFGADSKPSSVAGELGNGSRITALDTVPFCLWSAVRTDNYEDAMWYTVGVLGDRDTNCAIVGGILASSPKVIVPSRWVGAREPI